MHKSAKLSLLMALCLPASPHAGWYDLGSGEAAPASAWLFEQRGETAVVGFTVRGFHLSPTDIGGSEFGRISLPGATPLLEKGFPDLPKIRKSLVIPDDAEMGVRILEAEERLLRVGRVAPSKGSLPRTVDPESVPYTFGPFYESEGVYPAERVSLSEPFIVRDCRAITVQFNPFRYAPADGSLRVCTRLVAEVFPVGAARRNRLSLRGERPGRAAFEPVYRSLFMNYDTAGEENLRLYTPVSEPGCLLIVAPGALHSAAQPLAEWKRMRGLRVDMLEYPGDTGSGSAALKSCFQSAYDSPEGLTYAVLVGDAAQLPTLYGTAEGAASDPCYVKLAGSDHYPDAYISRLSATTAADVENQVSKIVDYERDPDTGASAAWYSKGCGIASDEGGWSGLADWERCDLLRGDLLNFTYSAVDRIYDPGASDAQVTAALNDGRSIVNYIGHGGETDWGTTDFNNADINNLNNGSKLPFILDVACVNGAFTWTGGDCFAERWLKAGTAASPKGAVGIYAASTNTDWLPPCAMQAEAVDLLVGGARVTFGGLCFNGVMKAMDDYPGYTGTMLMEQYNLFGDCSLVVRTEAPAALGVAHPGAIAHGAATDVEVTVTSGGSPVEGAAVCLSHETEVADHWAATTNASGEATLAGVVASRAGAYRLVVTSFNAVPYEGEVVSGNYVPADLNYDESVDVADLSLLVDRFGSPGPLGDIVDDDIVNALDMGCMMSAWAP